MSAKLVWSCGVGREPRHPGPRHALPARSRGGAYLKVMGVLGLVALVWLAFYLRSRALEFETVQIRLRVNDMLKAAEKCGEAVESYYGIRSRMPKAEADVTCASAVPHAAKPQVAGGTITVEAAGAFGELLAKKKIGTTLRYTPVCDSGMCVGSPIASWDCKTGTTIAASYLPEKCR